MSHDYFDPYDIDDEHGATCNRCGESGLEWFDTGVRWRLIDEDGNFHVCKNDAAIDDFEVLE
jgi:hypothetical protein